jgi:hypothetical protein
MGASVRPRRSNRGRDSNPRPSGYELPEADAGRFDSAVICGDFVPLGALSSAQFGTSNGTLVTTARRIDQMTSNPKETVVRLIVEVMNGGRLDLTDELCSPEMAGPLREWIGPFRKAFPDVEMEIVELVAEGEKVVGRFKCSGTNLGEWRGRPPTGRRFEGIDEVYFFRVVDGRIAEAWGLEDTAGRLSQLGMEGSPSD